MSEPSSYRTILRSSSIMGAASVLNILAGLAKMKVAAVLLGPAGVGLIGLYQNLMSTATVIASLGLNTVGTRQIAAAEAEGGAEAVGRVRRALMLGTLILALVGAALTVAASGLIATHMLHDPSRQGEVAWLSLGVGLSVAAGSQGALLTGLRRIGDLARISVGSGLLGAAFGALAIWIWGADGLLAMLLVAPLVTFALGHWFVHRLDRPATTALPFAALTQQWRLMLALGVAFMLSGLVTTAGQLAVRSLIQRDLGLDAVGQFQAAWAVGMTYLTFILGAMGTDYFPRLTAAIGDRATAVRLVNEQTEVALLLCGPVLLAMMGLAPWVISLLYSDAFGPAVDVLRWQLLGDILKVMSWPLGFVILAQGASRLFLATETAGIGTFVVATALTLPLLGVTASGVSFLIMYAIYLPVVYLVARHRIGFRWSAAVVWQAGALLAASCALLAAASVSKLAAAAAGVVCAGAFGVWALIRLGQHGALPGPLGRVAGVSDRIVSRRN